MGQLALDMNGAPTGEGFVIVSSPPHSFPAMLSLRTTDGSERDVECRLRQGSAATLSITPSTVHISGAPVAVEVLATDASANQNDTVIEVVEGTDVVARFELTSIASPVVRFTGRFQCRLASDGDCFNTLWGTRRSWFRLYAVQGGNPLDPAGPPDEPELDRNIRLHEAVALRPFCDPLGVTVKNIEADAGGSRLHFSVGDPLLGVPVRLGPTSRFNEQDGRFAVLGYAPISNFQLAVGDVFSGTSAPALPRPDANVLPDSSAPYGEGIVDLLKSLDPPWSPSDLGYDVATWEDHSEAVFAKKLKHLETQQPTDARAARIRARRLVEHQGEASSRGIKDGLLSMQRYTGKIDREVVIAPNPKGTLAYLATLAKVKFSADFLDFDSDCQSGTVTGTLGDLEPWPPIATAVRFPVGKGRGSPNPVDDEPL